MRTGGASGAHGTEREGTMRTLLEFGAAIVMAIVAVSPAAARVVRIQTAVNLPDRSDPTIKQALLDAFDTSLRGAVAMGLTHIRVDEVHVLQDVVVLAMVASDERDEDEASDDTRGE
jgi:hypothetical protein